MLNRLCLSGRGNYRHYNMSVACGPCYALILHRHYPQSRYPLLSLTRPACTVVKIYFICHHVFFQRVHWCLLAITWWRMTVRPSGWVQLPKSYADRCLHLYQIQNRISEVLNNGLVRPFRDNPLLIQRRTSTGSLNVRHLSIKPCYPFPDGRAVMFVSPLCLITPFSNMFVKTNTFVKTHW